MSCAYLPGPALPATPPLLHGHRRDASALERPPAPDRAQGRRLGLASPRVCPQGLGRTLRCLCPSRGLGVSFQECTRHEGLGRGCLCLRLCAAAVRAAAVGAGRGGTDHGALRGDAPGHAPCSPHSWHVPRLGPAPDHRTRCPAGTAGPRMPREPGQSGRLHPGGVREPHRRGPKVQVSGPSGVGRALPPDAGPSPRSSCRQSGLLVATTQSKATALAAGCAFLAPCGRQGF